MLLTKEQLDEIMSKLSDEAKEVIKKYTDQLNDSVSGTYKKLLDGTATQKDFEEYKALTESKQREMDDALKNINVNLTDIQKANTPAFESVETQVKKAFEDKESVDRAKKKAGIMEIVIKAAGITATVGLGGNGASVLEGGSAAGLLRLGAADASIFAQQRGIPFILNFVTVGNSDQPVIIWFDENDKQGDFAITAEGGLKPLVQYIFTRKTAEYKKAAGRVIVTEEFDRDFPRLVSQIKQLINIDVRNDMNAQILTDMIAAASPYAFNGLDGLVSDPDDYAAIGAAVAQIQSLYFTPNILVLNTADAMRMRLQKDLEGRYVIPPFKWDGSTYEFGTVIVDPRVPVGHFFIGDGTLFNVVLRGDVTIRIGYGASTDDFNKNQYTMVAEQWFFDYISTAKKPGFVYADYATIKADIAVV